MPTEWKGEHGRGGVVVYGRNSIRGQWEPGISDDKYKTVHEFESSSMYPFTGSAIGEFDVEKVMWDDDTETIVVIVDD
jgi:hypothetical protein